MFRPYRHVATADLAASRDALFRSVQRCVDQHWDILINDYRRELRRVSRELDRRSENNS